MSDLRGEQRLRLIARGVPAALLVFALGLGCATPGLREGAVAGAATGAALGAAVAGESGPGALAGAAAGGLLGALVGAAIADPKARGPDRDADGVADAQDNCPDRPNRSQQDVDGNGVVDACDPD